MERARVSDQSKQPTGDRLAGPFFWLTAFYFVYCARPEDWIPGIGSLPLAKITCILAILALLLSGEKTARKLSDLPREGKYLVLLIAILFLSALLSPIWKGGAFFNTLDFAKVGIDWILSFLLITSFIRLRRLLFIQSAAVAVIAVVAILKGHSAPRLGGVINGIYSNPNDLALAVVLSLPFCLAFLLTSKHILGKGFWYVALLAMIVALCLTASRAGFVEFVVVGALCFWHFGIKGKHFLLAGAATVLGLVVFLAAGQTLMKRFVVIFTGDVNSQLEGTAYGSYEERRLLMSKAVDAISEYPILGVGADNFVAYSGLWKQVHVSYLQIAADGGIPVLVLYLLFLRSGFKNLKHLRRATLDQEMALFVGALHSSLAGFVVGACFAPVAYHYFPYFSVCYISVLAAIVKERELRPNAMSSVDLSQPYLAKMYASNGTVLAPSR